MDPYSSPYIIPNNSLRDPFPDSLLRTDRLEDRSADPWSNPFFKTFSGGAHRHCWAESSSPFNLTKEM